jgi:hypothetical protein
LEIDQSAESVESILYRGHTMPLQNRWNVRDFDDFYAFREVRAGGSPGAAFRPESALK